MKKTLLMLVLVSGFVSLNALRPRGVSSNDVGTPGFHDKVRQAYERLADLLRKRDQGIIDPTTTEDEAQALASSEASIRAYMERPFLK
jgi:hypothetical protein